MSSSLNPLINKVLSFYKQIITNMIEFLNHVLNISTYISYIHHSFTTSFTAFTTTILIPILSNCMDLQRTRENKKSHSHHNYSFAVFSHLTFIFFSFLYFLVLTPLTLIFNSLSLIFSLIDFRLSLSFSFSRRYASSPGR